MILGLSPLQLALAALLPLVISLALGGWTIQVLRALRAGQRVRDDGPQRHLQKEGTPTMGGVLLIGALLLGAVVSCLAAFGWLPVQVLLVLGLTLAMGAIGFADDYLKIKRGRSLGLKAREKLLWQFIVAIIFVILLGMQKRLGWALPGSFFTSTPTPIWAAFWIFAIVGTANAVNLADGLDGLATGLCLTAGLGFAALSIFIAQPYVLIIALAVVGACLGFLWFNRHPARMFMGDVGSLALGGVLVGMAALLDRPIALIGLCLMPFLEAVSVIIQVISFKTTGKRVFKMTPIHHHFELSGWSEQKVVLAFWLIGLVAAIVTVFFEIQLGA